MGKVWKKSECRFYFRGMTLTVVVVVAVAVAAATTAVCVFNSCQLTRGNVRTSSAPLRDVYKGYYSFFH